jgi:dolichol-phosphate mannosyltransferase
VIPLYNEEENVPGLVKRLDELSRLNPDVDLELVAVDDGSSDGTIEALLELMEPDQRFTLVELARNFGSHNAVSAGLDQSTGDCAIVLGADLQEPADLPSRFLHEWRGGYDVVWGVRHTRAVKGIGTTISRIFSGLFHRYSEIPTYPVEGPSGVLVSKVVIDRLREMPERNRNVYGLIAWLGFRSTEVRYDQAPRMAGKSKWTWSRLTKLAVDSFVEFSSAPLRAAAIIGASLAAIGFLYAIVIAIRSVVVGTAPEGWTTVTVLLLVLGGVQLLMLGVVGEYLWRTTDEARRRPVYVVRSVRRFGDG